MKRIANLFLCLCLALSLTVPCAMAAENAGSLIYDLTVEGADTLTAKTGSEITVSFRIRRGDSGTGSHALRIFQNEIIYDQDFFEFVEDSIQLVRGSGSALFQTRTDGTHIIKASYISSGGGDFAADEVFCTFRLKVIGSGSGWISCDWDCAKAYDGDNKALTVKDGDSNSRADVTVTADGPCHPFADVADDDWFHPAVDYVSQHGLMNGTSDTTFSPNSTMTRAMLVTVLCRMEGSPAVTGTNGFTDVKDGQWYTDAVIWANSNNIVTGYAGKFDPDGEITREQIATILYRYAEFKDYNVGAVADLSGYTDANSVSDWALTGMSWANAEGLLTGRTSTTLAPLGTASRAEVATILMRFCESIGN